MIEVWHRPDDMERSERLAIRSPIEGPDEHLKAVREVWKAGKYIKVAECLGDLDHAFSITQNRDDSWSMDGREGLVRTAPLKEHNGRTYGLKSSEIGDVFVKDGIAFVATEEGFVQL